MIKNSSDSVSRRFLTWKCLSFLLSLSLFLLPGLGLASLSSRHLRAYVCVNPCTHLSPLLTKALKSETGILAPSPLSPVYLYIGSFLLASAQGS